ncbi:hypothetical protein pb186bvf_006182 [Paramecium bursaria]
MTQFFIFMKSRIIIQYKMNFISLIIIGLTLAKPQEDLVDNIKLNEYANIQYDGQFQSFSGYLDASEDGATKFHYYFYVSDQGELEDINIPVLLWLNGGPGCSSLEGALNENGPFVFDKGDLTVHMNDYSWTKLVFITILFQAHMLYLESPAQVGFSYGDIFEMSDAKAAQQNLQAIISFFKKYPEIVEREFYISGESYAGIYIPTLVDQIIDYNLREKTTPKINIKGVAIGNGCTDPSECAEGSDTYPQYLISQLGRHNMIDDSLYQQYRAFTEAGTCANLTNLPQECIDLANTVDDQFKGLWFNQFNIYDKCWLSVTKSKNPGSRFAQQVGEDDYIDCSDSAGLYKFQTDPIWIELTNIDTTKSAAWEDCNNEYNNYIIDPRGSYYLYPKMIQNKIKILKFSGDIDAVVPITGTLFWIDKLQKEFNIQTIQEWQSWTIKGNRDVDDEQIAGEYWMLDGLTFATVRGAGHMVPTDKRPEAFQMIKYFFEGFPLK